MYCCLYHNKEMRWPSLEAAFSFFYSEMLMSPRSDATEHYIKVRLLMIKSGKEVIVRPFHKA
jgi:hypothetical protein